MRDDAVAIFTAGVAAVDPVAVVQRHAVLNGNALYVGETALDLNAFRRILVVGAGKAAASMAGALEDLLGDRISGGVVVVKDGHGIALRNIRVCQGGHPVPTAEGHKGTEQIISLVQSAEENDLILCVISGGGSALLTAPAEGLQLADKQAVTRLLLAAGATIHEINTVRKHLSRVKGGRLALNAFPATVVTLILSDVIGDDLDVIASGPMVPDASTFSDARDVLHRYSVWDRLPPMVRQYLDAGIAGTVSDTPKPGLPAFERCFNTIVGTNRQALSAAAGMAEQLGYYTSILSDKLNGEARDKAVELCEKAKVVLHKGTFRSLPACLLCGGETTVTIAGEGKGGRNQEFALAAAIAIANENNIVVMAAGTDGTDGPTDAAGAIADGSTMSRAQEKGMSPETFLEENNAYMFFKPLDDLLITGPTRTNVMDIYMALVRKPQE
ncbi:MAG: glycerate kinase [Desulfobacteraceae bacterium]|nr:glycerate kinase [Desulfobacteraceae bacterium]